MILRKALLVCAFVVAALFPASAKAAEPVPFTPEAFANAQAAQRLIVLHINAFWCPTCGVQRPVLADLLDRIAQSSEINNLTIFTVDFDSQKATVRRFNVHLPGTLIVFHGPMEVGRLIDETDPAVIKGLLVKAQNASPQEVQAWLGGARLLTVASFVLAILAGTLSILSPCVLPLIPLVVGGAAAGNRLGPLVLSVGVAISYVVAGLFIATIGFSIGLDLDVVRTTAAVLMSVVGIVLLSEPLQARFALAGGAISGSADRLIAHVTPSTLGGQFTIGVLLGAVWTPCVGPTLAAAVTLAAGRQSVAQVGVVMLLFGLGATIPLAIVGTLSRQALTSWQERIHAVGRSGHIVLGVLLIAVSAAVLSGIDRSAEAFLLRISPQWLIHAAIRF